MMQTLTNSPQEASVIEAEARKSFSFAIWLKDQNGNPTDITGTSTTFTVGTIDRYGVSTVLFSKTADIQAPTLGYETVHVQASDLNLKPGVYQFTTTLRIQGYSVVLLKGDFKVLQNTEFASVDEHYVVNNPAQNLEITLRDKLNVHIKLGSVLPPNMTIPTDASDAGVAAYINNQSSLTFQALNGLFVTEVELDEHTEWVSDQLALTLDAANDYADAGLALKASITQLNLKADKTYVDSQDNARVARSLYTAKGQILAATAASTPSALPVGSNGQVLMADSTQTRGMKWDDVTMSARAKGVLEASYRGGPAKVKVDGVLSSEAYNWLTPYEPGSSREVRLEKFGSSWLITGQTEENSVPLQLQNNWITYTELAVTTTFSTVPRAVKLPSGIVVLTGLLYVTAAPAAGNLIFVLPVGMRPDYDLLYKVEMADQARTINIRANGNVEVYGNGWPSNYLTLDGIAFPAAGVASWTAITTWAANFDRNPAWDAAYGVPAYWKDPYGFVWFRGLARVAVATSADDTRMFNLPAGYVADQPQHIRTSGNDSYASVQFMNQGLNWKAASPGTVGTWISLAGVIGVTVEAGLNNPWRIFHRFGNSWANYNTANFPAAQWLLREDGLRMIRGLLTAGTLGQRATVTPTPEMWPRYGRLILPIVSNLARARMDISSVDERSTGGTPYEVGAIIHTQGASNWYSYDSVVWTT